MSTTIKKERRFSIINPVISEEWPVEFTKTLITQQYLLQERDDAVEKIKIVEVERDGYFDTKLVLDMEEILPDGISSNVEVELKPAEWMQLQERIDKSRSEIRKIRRQFAWNDKNYILDVFIMPETGWALLIIDWCGDESEVVIPGFLMNSSTKINDVTGLSDWTTSHLSFLKTTR